MDWCDIRECANTRTEKAIWYSTTFRPYLGIKISIRGLDRVRNLVPPVTLLRLLWTTLPMTWKRTWRGGPRRLPSTSLLVIPTCHEGTPLLTPGVSSILTYSSGTPDLCLSQG